MSGSDNYSVALQSGSEERLTAEKLVNPSPRHPPHTQQGGEQFREANWLFKTWAAPSRDKDAVRPPVLNTTFPCLTLPPWSHTQPCPSLIYGTPGSQCDPCRPTSLLIESPYTWTKSLLWPVDHGHPASPSPTSSGLFLRSQPREASPYYSASDTTASFQLGHQYHLPCFPNTITSAPALLYADGELGVQ